MVVVHGESGGTDSAGAERCHQAHGKVLEKFSQINTRLTKARAHWDPEQILGSRSDKDALDWSKVISQMEEANSHNGSL